jgi:predicted tellurium resistance membrane protein TerC
VFFASNLLCLVIERYPILNYVGCAVLAKVGAEMILTDPFVVRVLAPTMVFSYSAQIVYILAVIAAGHFWMKIARSEPKRITRGQPFPPPTSRIS